MPGALRGGLALATSGLPWSPPRANSRLGRLPTPLLQSRGWAEGQAGSQPCSLCTGRVGGLWPRGGPCSPERCCHSREPSQGWNNSLPPAGLKRFPWWVWDETGSLWGGACLLTCRGPSRSLRASTTQPRAYGPWRRDCGGR